VVLAKDIKSRESTRDWLLHEVIPKFPDVQMRVTRLENGPPVGYPVQMRISGEHIEKVQAIARRVEAKVRENPHVMNVNLDWSEPSKVVRLVIDQERARALGVSSAQVSQFLASSLAGQSVSVYREGNRQIEVGALKLECHLLVILGLLAVHDQQAHETQPSHRFSNRSRDANRAVSPAVSRNAFS